MGGYATRRGFILGAASAAAMAGFGPALSNRAVAAEGRRAITLGGQRARVVDIHGHAVIRDVLDVLRGTPLERGGVPEFQILGPERIAEMDARGIDIQALSINQYWWYEAEPALAADIVRTQDEGLAAWVRMHPDRFVALTSPALQHPELAADQLDYAVRTLGMRGASITGIVNGEMPSIEKFDPFWAKAEELGVPVFMHPTNGNGVILEEPFGERGDLTNVIGNPLETALFLTRMMFDGTLDRFPNLKICGAHGGGYLPSYFARTDVACEVRDNAACLNAKRPLEYLRTQIFADSMVFTDEGLRHLVAEMGASQIVYGTDIPFNWPDTIDIIVGAAFLSDAQKLAILGGNLSALLRIGA